MGLGTDYVDYQDLVLQASILSGQEIVESGRLLEAALNTTSAVAAVGGGGGTSSANRSGGHETGTGVVGGGEAFELEAELFHGYPPSLLTLATVFCLLFMLVGIPGNLITIIALFRCKKNAVCIPIKFFSDKGRCKDDPVLKNKEKEDGKECGTVCKPDDNVKVLQLKFPLKQTPCVDKPVVAGECLRPYTNPCPPYPPCDPAFLPVHPCRRKPERNIQESDVAVELSPRARRILFAASGILAAIVIYECLMSGDEPVDCNVMKPRCVLRPQYITKVPVEASQIPSETKYLIVGGGTAAFSAFRTIKNLDPEAKIMVISEEPYSPYMRPPLNKELLTNENREMSREFKFKTKKSRFKKSVDQSLFFEHEDFFIPIADFESASEGIAIVKGYKVASIDYYNKKAKIENGPIISYDKCLLATGARSKKLSVFEFNTEDVINKVTNYRTAYDFLEVEDVINCGAKTIGVFGGTTLACEIATSLTKRGINVIQFIEEENLMADKLPTYLAEILTKKFEREGVTVMKKTRIEDAMISNKRLKLITSNRASVVVDHAIVAHGTEANTDVAEPSGIETDCKNGGFVVTPEMEIRTDHYSAGDCTSFYHPLLGRRRLENHDHAMATGRIAGENMTGGKSAYVTESHSWADLTRSIEVESVGIIDSALPTVGVFLDKDISKEQEKDGSVDTSNEHNKGIVFYLKDNRVVGILTWNAAGRLSVARKVLLNNVSYEEIDEASKLFGLQM